MEGRRVGKGRRRQGRALSPHVDAGLSSSDPSFELPTTLASSPPRPPLPTRQTLSATPDHLRFHGF